MIATVTETVRVKEKVLVKSSFLALIFFGSQPRLQFPTHPFGFRFLSLSASSFLSHPTRSVCHLCDCFGCQYCFSFLSHVSSCCLLIPQAGAAHLECIILIGPGEGDRLEGQLVGSKKRRSTEGEKFCQIIPVHIVRSACQSLRGNQQQLMTRRRRSNPPQSQDTSSAPHHNSQFVSNW